MMKWGHLPEEAVGPSVRERWCGQRSVGERG